MPIVHTPTLNVLNLKYFYDTTPEICNSKNYLINIREDDDLEVKVKDAVTGDEDDDNFKIEWNSRCDIEISHQFTDSTPTNTYTIEVKIGDWHINTGK